MKDLTNRSVGLGTHLSYVICVALSLLLVGVLTGTGPLSPTMVLADDDDDDGDDDGGGGGVGGGGFGSETSDSFSPNARRGSGNRGGRWNPFRRAEPRRQRTRQQRRVRRPARQQRPARRRARAAPPAVVLPDRIADEIVALGLSEDQLAILVGNGYVVLQQDTIVRLAATLVRLRVPSGTTLEAAREEVRALNPAAQADFNHLYRPVSREIGTCEALSCTAAEQIAWPSPPGTSGHCAGEIAIGIVDTGINAEHEALREADLSVIAFDTERDARSSSRQHGTAVAAIILSGAASRAPGLIPDAQVFAVDAFFRTTASGGVLDERTDAFTLVRAIDVVTQNAITVLNLSLAGPANTTLEDIVADVADAGIVIVASTGNGGPRAKPAYPAAYEDVIGVTAVAHTGRVFRRAGRGAHVDLAAPGVEVWTAASVRGVKPRTGTSFAAPFVTAAVALAQSAHGLAGHDAVLAALADSAKDLGADGRDDIYGFGLVQALPSCGAPPLTSSDPPGELQPASMAGTGTAEDGS